ncbi:hypothetical protein [Methanobrevibacter sp.]
MIRFSIVNVYLLIRVVLPYDFSGVLSMRQMEVKKVELIIFIIGSYCRIS